MEASKLHVAVLSSPGMGHLIPVILLANRLIIQHNLHVTVLVVTTNTSSAESQLLKPTQGPKLLNIIEIPPAHISSEPLESDAAMVTRLAVMMRSALPGIRAAISAMGRRPDVFIGDLFCTEAFPIAVELGIPKYVFVPTTAWFTALTSYCQVLDKEIKGQYVDQKEPLNIPGCRPVRPEDVVDPMLDRNNQQYREYLRLGSEFSLFDGILLNTWEDLERSSLNALREDQILRSVVKVPVYPIGPLSRTIEPEGSNSELIGWIDAQPTESVLYVSYGSGGTLSAEQITELAWGLELSRQRFVWVVREPNDSGADASFLTSGNGQDCSEPKYLPEGFLSRTQKVGVVVPEWAPQVAILRHAAVGGFLSHCGWNSILEGISGGVAMIAWPLYAEQRLNATMLVEELGVALRPEVLPTKKVVGREEIERMVRRVMESEEGHVMRKKVKEVRNSGVRDLEKGGYSYNSMSEVIMQCQSRLKCS